MCDSDLNHRAGEDHCEVRYFVAKCQNFDALRTCQQSKIWACRPRCSPPHPKDILATALEQGKVILVFSVNNCHGWHGYASMLTAPGTVTDENVPNLKSSESDCLNQEKQEQMSAWFRFNVQWHKLYLDQFGEQCLPSSQTKDMTCSETDDLPLNKARNFQELSQEMGQKLCHLIDEHYQMLCDVRKEKQLELAQKQEPAFFSAGVEDDREKIWQELHEKVSKLGKVHLACYFGSQRYNLHTPDSDLDMFFVYSADTRDVLGFSPPQQTIKNNNTEAHDYSIVEIHRYSELLLSGDPRCVETLFLHPSSVYTSSVEWRNLTNHRRGFLTSQVLDKYMRDATGSKGTKHLMKLQESTDTPHGPMNKKLSKLCYIIIRLLQNARNIACGEDLMVYRPEGSAERDLLMKTRQGTLTFEEAKSIIDRLINDVEKGRQHLGHSQYKEEQRKILEDWLMGIRYTNFRDYMDNIEKTS